MDGNIRIYKRMMLLVSLFLIISIFPVNAKVDAKKLKAFVYEGLESTNPDVKLTAVKVIKYLSDPDGKNYLKILELFEGFDFKQTVPAFEYIKYEAIRTLYYMNERATMKILIENNDYILSVFDLYKLFLILGFDRITEFDNVFYYAEANYEASKNIEVFKSICYAEHYLKTNDKKFLYFVKFKNLKYLTPEQYLKLYMYYKKNKLPTRQIEYFIKDNGGIMSVYGSDHTMINKTYSLDQMLYQALLKRLKLTDEVYNTVQRWPYYAIKVDGKVIGIHDDELYSVDLEHFDDFEYIKVYTELQLDTSTLGYSDFFPLADAMAKLYAGKADSTHTNLIEKRYDSQTEPMQYKIIKTILHAPVNKEQEKLVRWLLHKGLSEAFFVAAYYSGYSEHNPRKLINDLAAVLDLYKNEALTLSVLEIIGNTRNKKYLKEIEKYFDDSSPIIAMTARGQYIRLKSKLK